MSLSYQVKILVERRAAERRAFNDSLLGDLDDLGSMFEEFDPGLESRLRNVGIKKYGNQAHFAALESSRRAARALLEGQRRHASDVTRLARTYSAEALREGSVANVLKANRREAFEEAEEIHRLGIMQADQLQARIDAENENRRRAEKSAEWGVFGGVAGAVVGGFVGGPAGAAAGYAIGSGTGSYVGAQHG